MPGWFETFKGALSDIPRNEPIHDDLAWVSGYNAEVRRLQTVINSARTHIRDIATRIAGDALDGPLTGTEVGRYRDQVKPWVSAPGWEAYDQYLRANRIEGGVASYGDAIRLLLGTRFGPSWTPVMKPRPANAGAPPRG